MYRLVPVKGLFDPPELELKEDVEGWDVHWLVSKGKDMTEPCRVKRGVRTVTDRRIRKDDYTPGSGGLSSLPP